MYVYLEQLELEGQVSDLLAVEVKKVQSTSALQFTVYFRILGPIDN